MTLNSGFRTDLERQVARLKGDHVYKTLNHLDSPQAARVRMEGRGEVLILSSNNYLGDRKSTRLNSSHIQKSRMPSSA